MWRVQNSFWFQISIKAQIEIWEIFFHFLISVSKIWQPRMKVIQFAVKRKNLYGQSERPYYLSYFIIKTVSVFA